MKGSPQMKMGLGLNEKTKEGFLEETDERKLTLLSLSKAKKTLPLFL